MIKNLHARIQEANKLSSKLDELFNTNSIAM